eukprot:5942609-Amphidinium_carterae.4
MMIPVPSGRNLTLQHGSSHQVAIGPAAYRDDLAISITGDSNAQLLVKLAHMAEIVQDVHSRFHLQVNWAAGKIEAVLSLVGSTSKPILQGLLQIGHRHNMGRPALALQHQKLLTIAKQYPHLGCIHMQSLSLHGEVQQMIGRARSALAEKKKVLNSKEIRLHDRVTLHKVYVVCHLLQNVTVLQPFQPGHVKRLHAMYMQGLRTCADSRVVRKDSVKLTNAQVIQRCQVPSLECLMDRRILGSMVRLAANCGDMVRASCALCSSNLTFWPRLLGALQRLHTALPAVQHLPVPTLDTIDEWAAYA